MKQEIKDQWVAALEGGEYKQGRGKLREGDQFCCLGVLCDLHAKAVGGLWGGGWYLSHNTLLPSEVIEWAFGPVTGDSPWTPGYGLQVTIEGETRSLVEHNDGIKDWAPRTFLEIAKAIKEQA